MARYLETADQLRKEVESFMVAITLEDADMGQLAVQLGHIINLAVRCNPRQAQGTVRKNIVAKAMMKYCSVTMTKEYDERTDRQFNKIHIKPRS